MRALINGMGLLALCSCLTIACEGPQGPAGADGLNGLDGVNGVDGEDGTDGQHRTDVPAAVDITITSVDMATPAVI